MLKDEQRMMNFEVSIKNKTPDSRLKVEQSGAIPERSEQTGDLFAKKTKLRIPERSEQTGDLFAKKTKLR